MAMFALFDNHHSEYHPWLWQKQRIIPIEPMNLKPPLLRPVNWVDLSLFMLMNPPGSLVQKTSVCPS